MDEDTDDATLVTVYDGGKSLVDDDDDEDTIGEVMLVLYGFNIEVDVTGGPLTGRCTGWM